MKTFSRVRIGQGSSIHYSVHCSNQDEHPPPLFGPFSPSATPLGWDSPGVAGDERGLRGGEMP